MTAGMRSHEGVYDQMKAIHPIGRFGRSEEIAAAVLYLSSQNAGFVTGIALPVDDGAAA
jgi:NAD(P)-dependent dehydrogenase (short-subunit alcohol dehydrogenase family)